MTVPCLMYVSCVMFHFILFLPDKQLVTISRLSGAVSASVVVLKNYDNTGKVFQSVLNVMKIYSSSRKIF